MTRKRLWKSLAAWALIAGLVFSDGSYIAYAQNAEPQGESEKTEETDGKKSSETDDGTLKEGSEEKKEEDETKVSGTKEEKQEPQQNIEEIAGEDNKVSDTDEGADEAAPKIQKAGENAQARTVESIPILPMDGEIRSGEGSECTWLYEGEEQTFYFDDEENLGLQWIVRDEAWNEYSAASAPITWSVSENTITVTANKSDGLVYITLYDSNGNGSIGTMLVELRERKSIPSFGYSDKFIDLPGSNRSIDKNEAGYWYIEDENQPYGNEVPMLARSVSSSDKSIVSVKEESDEWILEAKKTGEAKITIVCEMENDRSKTYTAQIQFYVKNEVYNDIEISTENGTDSILYGDTCKLTAYVRGDYLDDEGDIYPADTANVTYVWDYEVFDSYTDENVDDSAEVEQKVRLQPD